MSMYLLALQTQDLPQTTYLIGYMFPTTTLRTSTSTEYRDCGINYNNQSEPVTACQLYIY